MYRIYKDISWINNRLLWNVLYKFYQIRCAKRLVINLIFIKIYWRYVSLSRFIVERDWLLSLKCPMCHESANKLWKHIQVIFFYTDNFFFKWYIFIFHISQKRSHVIIFFEYLSSFFLYLNLHQIYFCIYNII